MLYHIIQPSRYSQNIEINYQLYYYTIIQIRLQLLNSNYCKPTKRLDEMEVFLSSGIAAYEVSYISLKSDERKIRGKLFYHKCKHMNPMHFYLFFESKNYQIAHQLIEFINVIYLIKCQQMIRGMLFELPNCFNCLNYDHQVATYKYPTYPSVVKKHNSKLHNESWLQ